MRSPRARSSPGDLEAVALRHQHVEHDRVQRRPDADRAEGLLAVGGQLDLVALELQRPLERPAELRLVVYDQYSHGLMLAGSHKRSLRISSRAPSLGMARLDIGRVNAPSGLDCRPDLPIGVRDALAQAHRFAPPAAGGVAGTPWPRVFSDHSDDYGRVPLPQGGTVHLPEGKVTVFYRRAVTPPSTGVERRGLTFQVPPARRRPADRDDARQRRRPRSVAVQPSETIGELGAWRSSTSRRPATTWSAAAPTCRRAPPRWNSARTPAALLERWKLLAGLLARGPVLTLIPVPRSGRRRRGRRREPHWSSDPRAPYAGLAGPPGGTAAAPAGRNAAPPARSSARRSARRSATPGAARPGPGSGGLQRGGVAGGRRPGEPVELLLRRAQRRPGGQGRPEPARARGRAPAARRSASSFGPEPCPAPSPVGSRRRAPRARAPRRPLRERSAVPAPEGSLAELAWTRRAAARAPGRRRPRGSGAVRAELLSPG